MYLLWSKIGVKSDILTVFQQSHEWSLTEAPQRSDFMLIQRSPLKWSMCGLVEKVLKNDENWLFFDVFWSFLMCGPGLRSDMGFVTCAHTPMLVQTLKMTQNTLFFILNIKNKLLNRSISMTIDLIESRYWTSGHVSFFDGQYVAK
jgi:hypothetical protein